MSDTPYDVVVIGAGPGGYVAAIRAAQLGLRTAIVERQYWGGVCLNVGCIPTKALLHTADLLEEVREGQRFGVVAPQVSLDWEAVLQHKDQVVKQMTGGVNFLMKKNKIDVHTGTARLRPSTSAGQPSSGLAPMGNVATRAHLSEIRVLCGNGSVRTKLVGESTPNDIHRCLNAADWDANAVRDDVRTLRKGENAC